MLRIAAGLGSSLLAGLLAWAGNSISDMKRDISALQSTIKSMEDKIAVKTEDRYRAGDARRDLALVNERIDENLRRIAFCERRIGLARP